MTAEHAFNLDSFGVPDLWDQTRGLVSELPNLYVARYYDAGTLVYATLGWDGQAERQLIRIEDAQLDDSTEERSLANEIQNTMGSAEMRHGWTKDREPSASLSPEAQHAVAQRFLSSPYEINMSPLVTTGMRENPEDRIFFDGRSAIYNRQNVRKLACINLSLATLLGHETAEYEEIVTRANAWKLIDTKPYSWL